MRFTEIIEKEYESVSETAVGKLVSPKKMEKLEYELMPRQDTYAEGVHTLRNSYAEKEAEVPSYLWYDSVDQKIVRSLTFRENLQARVDDFETLKNKNGSTRTIKERFRLFDTWLDSCTGIVYSSKNEDDFMIIPVCKELITIPKNFSNEYISMDYASLQDRGTRLKRSQAKYNEFLTESEVISHPAWIASVEEDITLLSTYISIAFKHSSRSEGKLMGFYLRNKIEKDQLRSLFVGIRYDDSGANGGGSLDCGSVFLRGTSPS